MPPPSNFQWLRIYLCIKGKVLTGPSVTCYLSAHFGRPSCPPAPTTLTSLCLEWHPSPLGPSLWLLPLPGVPSHLPLTTSKLCSNLTSPGMLTVTTYLILKLTTHPPTPVPTSNTPLFFIPCFAFSTALSSNSCQCPLAKDHQERTCSGTCSANYCCNDR